MEGFEKVIHQEKRITFTVTVAENGFAIEHCANWRPITNRGMFVASSCSEAGEEIRKKLEQVQGWIEYEKTQLKLGIETAEDLT